MKRVKSAFSLIELSVVILIIGILVIGITKGSRIIKSTKLTSARSLSRSSPVASTQNLVAWYDATAENSLISGNYNTNTSDTTNISDGSPIKTWKDVNPQSVSKADGTVVISDNNRAIYTDNAINGLPGLTFDGANDYFTLPNGTVPYGDSKYTVFFVSKVPSFGYYGLLGSGTYGTNNLTNAFRYHDNINAFYNYWWNIDLYAPTNPIIRNKPHILSFVYNGSNRYGYINGSLVAGPTASSGRASTPINNTIGVTNNTEYMNGVIGEIIIFDRALTTTERTNIEQYLIKKWSIK